ncbi:hypothetical protein Tco_1548769 [Tanacetum coccineum]
MTMVIIEKFEKLGLLEIDEELFTYDTQLGIIFNEFNKQRETYAREIRGDDEVEFTNEESFDPNDKNLIEGNEVAKIFRIKTNVFNFETPTCRAFKEFNYLLQIDLEVLTKDIDGFKTYEEYKDD